MKKFIIIILTLITSAVFAQSNLQDVVYLKNGSIIRGTVIEQVPNVSIKIQTIDRNVFVYKMEEIEKISKEEISTYGKTLSNRQTFQPGYKGILDVGYQVGVGNYGIDRIKLNYINSIQVSPIFAVGIGTGVNYYFDANEDALLVPIYGDFRANFLDGNVSPFVSFGIGYSFDATNNFVGTGLLISPAAGVAFKVADRSTMNLSLGYDVQKIPYYGYNYNYYYKSSINSGAISINLGFSF